MNLTVSESGIATFTLDNPPVNAIGEPELHEMSSAVEILRTSTHLSAVVFRSRGRHFSAGADMKLIASWDDDTDPGYQMVSYSALLQDLFFRIEHLPMPTIAVIDGTAAGAGLELALACDLRVLGANAKLGLPEARFGWIASAGGTQRLTRQIGPSAALKLMLFDEMIGADEAFRLGLGQWISQAGDDLEGLVEALTVRLAQLPKAAVRAIKQLVSSDSGSGFSKELLYTRLLEQEPESKVLFRSFLESRRRAKGAN